MAGRAGARLGLRAAIWLAAVGGLLLLARSVSWPRLVAAFRQADVAMLAAAAGLMLLSFTMQGVRWHQVVQAVKPVPLPTVLAASFAGQGASLVLPLRAGEAVRLELLSRATGLSRAAALGTVATDHALNGLVMFTLAALSPLFLPVPPAARAAIWIGAAAVVGLLAVLLRVSASQDVTRLPRTRVGRALRKLREGVSALRQPKYAARAALASALGWTCEVLAAAAALAAFGLHDGLLGGAAVVFGVNLAIAAPAPPGNLGTFELGAAMALMAFGRPAQAAAIFALAYHALQMLPVMLFGAAGLLQLKQAAGKQLAENEAAGYPLPAASSTNAA